jgi:hypothetical protein
MFTVFASEGKELSATLYPSADDRTDTKRSQQLGLEFERSSTLGGYGVGFFSPCSFSPGASWGFRRFDFSVVGLEAAPPFVSRRRLCLCIPS